MLKQFINTLFFHFLILNLISKFKQESICNFNDINSFCQTCNNEENDYSQCNYKDLYCILSNGKNIYNECKYLYSRDLRNNMDNNIICGDKDIEFTTNNYTQNLFQIKEENKNNLNNLNFLHCDYNLKVNNLNDSSTNKINITITFENKDNYNENNFNFFFFLLKNNIFNADNLITKEKFITNSKTITLEYFQNISLYIDINIPQNFFPYFYIKIDYFNIENEEGEEIEMEKEDMYPLYLTLYIAVPLLILLIALIIYLCCKNQDTGILGGEIRVIGFANLDNEIALQREENEENDKSRKINENKKKLMILFKTILGAQEYTKFHNKIDCPKCTICYEDFELYNSVVSITPCQHIFHYRCLHNWLNKNIMNTPKCPNCNFDFMTVDINKLRQKSQNNTIQREGTVTENLLGSNNSKSSSSNNNITNIILNRKKKNNNDGNNNNNLRAITISHISINYSSNKKNENSESENNNEKENEKENDSEENEQNESDDENDDIELYNANIFSSQNRLNDDEEDQKDNNTKNKKKNENKNSEKNDDKYNFIVNNDNNMEIKTVIQKKKKKIIYSSGSKEENDENIDKNNINENVSDNKNSYKNASSIESESLNDTSTKRKSTNQKKEGYKTLSQEMMNSTRRTLK